MAHSAHGLSKLDHLMKECVSHHALNDPAPLPQTFGYLLSENPITGNLSKQTIVDGFDALVETMRTDQITAGPADAGMTFLGQFVDHDITFDATSAIGTRIDPRTIRNVRTPGLDLDCVYGDGPDASPHLYAHGAGHEGFMLMGTAAHEWDLPRNTHGRALIGDPRNDENIIISQLQAAFIMLHNILMTHAGDGGDTAHDIASCAAMGVRTEVFSDHMPPHLQDFEAVRRFIRLHYQWIVLNEMLPAFVDPKVIDHVLHHDPFPDAPMMPAEFSVAAYRFGHATVQPEYTLRAGEAPLHLFALRGFQPRDAGADIEMAQFFGPDAQKALPVGTKMVATLFDLPDNIVGGGLTWGEHDIPVTQAKKLALRNILRDRTALHLPSGQQMARHLGLTPLPAPKALTDHHITKTPLWFYCLQEAQEQGGGKLTGVGGKIVASVIVRLLRCDPESILNNLGFTPWSGFGQTCSMANVMAFVEQHRGDVKDREALFCG